MKKFELNSIAIYAIVDNGFIFALSPLSALQTDFEVDQFIISAKHFVDRVREASNNDVELTEETFVKLQNDVCALCHGVDNLTSDYDNATWWLMSSRTAFAQLRATLNSIAIANNLPTVY